MAKVRLFIGLMSGTSSDGVDAALTSIARGRRGAMDVSLVAFETIPYTKRLRERVLKVAGEGRAALGELASLDVELGRRFAEAAVLVAEKAGVDLKDVAAIGSHGQTVFHCPKPKRGSGLKPSTLQIASPAVISERTGCRVVADFRQADLAAGGEGAPLSPHGHALLFRHPRRGRLVLNLGGIANLSVVPAGARGRSPADVIAFDTGPGNMVMDALVEETSEGRKTFDRGGRTAARGRVDEELLKELLKEPYFRRPPPKSTGREAFGRPFALKLLKNITRRGGFVEDALATASALTVGSVARQIERFALTQGSYRELYLAGGGANNPHLVEMLTQALPSLKLHPVDVLGIPADALEAVIFALLAAETLDGRPVWLPKATGAKRPAVLGTITAGR